MGMGLVYSLANILVPLLGWSILPKVIEFNLFNGYIVLHSWNIFILISAIPSLFSGIAHSFLPESPKFLMTMGKNQEALESFKVVYSMNTGKPKNTFPVSLIFIFIKFLLH